MICEGGFEVIDNGMSEKMGEMSGDAEQRHFKHSLRYTAQFLYIHDLHAKGVGSSKP